MAVRRIVQLGDPVLRMMAKRVHRVDGPIQALIDDLLETVEHANGAGLAAPQIGVPLRVIVVTVEEPIVIVNPEITRLSDETETLDEGCLSIAGYAGPVERSLYCQVRGLDRRGKKLKVNAEGYLARALQHEVDHINGVLYIDRVTDPKLIHRVEENYEVEDDSTLEAEHAPPAHVEAS